MTLSYGQRLIKRKGHGKPEIVYVVSTNPRYEHLIKLSPHFPYIPGLHNHFFVHRDKLFDFYRDEREGVQMTLFRRQNTIDNLKRKHLI